MKVGEPTREYFKWRERWLRIPKWLRIIILILSIPLYVPISAFKKIFEEHEIRDLRKHERRYLKQQRKKFGNPGRKIP